MYLYLIIVTLFPIIPTMIGPLLCPPHNQQMINLQIIPSPGMTAYWSGQDKSLLVLHFQSSVQCKCILAWARQIFISVTLSMICVMQRHK